MKDALSLCELGYKKKLKLFYNLRLLNAESAVKIRIIKYCAERLEFPLEWNHECYLTAGYKYEYSCS